MRIEEIDVLRHNFITLSYDTILTGGTPSEMNLFMSFEYLNQFSY